MGGLAAEALVLWSGPFREGGCCGEQFPGSAWALFSTMAARVATGVQLVRASGAGAPKQVAAIRRVGGAGARRSFFTGTKCWSQMSSRARTPSIAVHCSAEGADADSEPVGAEDGVKLAPITDPDASRKWLAGMIRVWLDEEWAELEVSVGCHRTCTGQCS